MTRARHVLSAIVALAVLLPASAAGADDKTRRRDGARDGALQQDEALSLLQRQELKPLSEVLAVAEKMIPGQVIRVRVKKRDGRIAYELKIIAAQGRVREIYIDAQTLETLKVE